MNRLSINFVLILVIFFAGCSGVFYLGGTTRNCILHSNVDSANIYLREAFSFEYTDYTPSSGFQFFNVEVRTAIDFKGKGDVKVDLKSLLPYLIRQDCNGYLPYTQAIFHARDSIKLEPIVQKPHKQADELGITISPVLNNIEPHSICWANYKKYEDYLADDNKPLETEEYLRSGLNESPNITALLDSELINYGFADSTLKINNISKGTLGLKIEIKSIKHIFINHCFCFTTIKAKFKLTSPYNESNNLEKTIEFRSSWHSIKYKRDEPDENKTEREEKMQIETNEALTIGLANFLNDKDVKKVLKKEKNIDTSNLWDIIELENKGQNSSVERSSKSVVTVIRKNRHSSGCVVSHNGYIVTNYRIAGDSSKRVKVIFADGSMDSATVIRASQLYDLALLKVNRTNLQELKIDTSNTFSLGTEIYAIATPSETELSQSVSKGIISGKRKINDIVYYQSDASVSAGSGGGAMVLPDGTLVGILNSKLIGRGVEGLGFSIPTSYLGKILKIRFK